MNVLRGLMASVALLTMCWVGAASAQPGHPVTRASEGTFVSGSVSSSSRLPAKTPAFVAVQEFLRRMDGTFLATSPGVRGFAWPTPNYFDVRTVAFAANREGMTHNAVGNYGVFLAADARHRPGDAISVISCGRPTVDGRTTSEPYSRRWEYRWESQEGRSGWRPERVEMVRVKTCLPLSGDLSG